jgi:integrase
LTPALGRLPLAKLTPQHVQKFMNEKLAAGLSARTVQYLRAVLRRALSQALRWNLVARNVATLVDAPKTKRNAVRVMSPDEVSLFLEAAKGQRFEPLLIVAISTGLRQGELLGLRWVDVDLPTSVIHVRHGIQRLNGRLTLTEPKTERSRRTLRLPQIAIRALQMQRARQNEERLGAGGRWNDLGFVFATSIGTPLDARNLTRHFARVLTRAGLPRLRFHSLRHSCASLLLTQHVPARAVMELLGHSEIRLTMDTYSHVMPQLMTEAANAMDDALGGRIS